MMFKRAKEHPGDDFYSALNAAEVDGRPLTDEENEGFAYLAFAGGRISLTWQLPIETRKFSKARTRFISIANRIRTSHLASVTTIV